MKRIVYKMGKFICVFFDTFTKVRMYGLHLGRILCVWVGDGGGYFYVFTILHVSEHSEQFFLGSILPQYIALSVRQLVGLFCFICQKKL